jgi:hypothetical protein
MLGEDMVAVEAIRLRVRSVADRAFAWAGHNANTRIASRYHRKAPRMQHVRN